MTLQVVASPTIIILTTLEVSFMLLANIYSRGITHDDRHVTIVIYLYYRPLVHPMPWQRMFVVSMSLLVSLCIHLFKPCLFFCVGGGVGRFEHGHVDLQVRGSLLVHEGLNGPEPHRGGWRSPAGVSRIKRFFFGGDGDATRRTNEPVCSSLASLWSRSY